MASIPEKWSNTIRKEEKTSVMWNILNFDCDKEIDSKVYPSTTFTFTGKLLYDIKMKIIGSTCKQRCIQITLPKISTVTKTRINLSVVCEDDKCHQADVVLGDGEGVHFYMFLKDKGCVIRGEHITILCEVILEYYESSDNFKGFVKRESHNHLKDLYTHKKYLDVIFVVAGHELNAHKCVLASRSEVFAAMFEHEMEESKSNKVIIDDIDFEVFDEMLRYIYTNEVLNLKQNASGLLAASEKYNLKDLKCVCEAELIHNVSKKNALETLMLADLYRAEELKNYTMNFINFNRKSFTNTDEWQKFVDTHAHLLLELYLK